MHITKRVRAAATGLVLAGTALVSATAATPAQACDNIPGCHPPDPGPSVRLHCNRKQDCDFAAEWYNMDYNDGYSQEACWVESAYPIDDGWFLVCM